MSGTSCLCIAQENTEEIWGLLYLNCNEPVRPWLFARLYKIKEAFDARLGWKTSDHTENEWDSSSEFEVSTYLIFQENVALLRNKSVKT